MSSHPSKEDPGAQSLRHLKLCGWLLFILIGGGTLGFYLTDQEHSLFHAFYLTIIILTTVGMEAAEGPERVVALFLMVGGIFTTIYAAGNLVAFIIDGEINKILGKKQLKDRIEKLNQHYIIVGFGRMGRALCAALHEKGQPFILVEKDPERLAMATGLGYLYVEGDAMDEATYEAARIVQARGLATCLPSDAANVYVTLLARGFSADLNIIAREEDINTHSKLIRAGADRVVCPPVLSAGKILAMMVTPVVDHGEHADEVSIDTKIEVHEVPVAEFPALVDRPLADNHVRTRTGMTVVAIDRGNKREMNPTALFSPLIDDRLILVGPEGGLEKMKELYGTSEKE